MARLDDSSAMNARMRQEVVYDLDPRGWGMFVSLASRLQRGMAGLDTPAVIERSGSWHGWTAPLQGFAGLAGLQAGRQRATAAANSTLADENTAALGSGPMRILANRLTRQN